MSEKIENVSKQLSKSDDSAATLLMELLDGSPGRNFDVESIFSFQNKQGNWGWLIFEFLKNDSEHTTIAQSHPNRYWHKNKRKFLSLWALKESLSHAGFHAALWLVNYDDNREQVKLMKVQGIEMKPTNNWFCENKETKFKEYLITNDECMSFDEFKKKFSKFNSNKKGDSWEILEYLNNSN